MTKEYVVLKGTKDGVNVILSPDMPFTIILNDVMEKFEKAKDFFSKGKCSINFSGRNITDGDRLKLENAVSKLLADCDIVMGYSDEATTEPEIFKNTKEGYTKFHEGTVRSGQILESEGNIVIIGDINPGGEIVAAGNIVVMGCVRGIVHAGCTGNRNAFIVALNLSPTQIRIADIITRQPDNDVRNDIVPEKAYITNDTIYIDEYLTKI